MLIFPALSSFLSQNPSIKVLKMDTDIEHIPVIAKGLRTSLVSIKCFMCHKHVIGYIVILKMFTNYYFILG